ncbi:MAG: 50S ribosomal protein L17 [Algoriphagus sp.]|jgi:large subunit ribosomal protein L17|uniref:50S ribosomal protein L17 n=1 Tax=Algoriphagus sp. TaxID=1872435 RepID=UPI002748B6FC|nr:50S ribosomal protein L17 [Algoriphagus sp.]MDP4748354.1 50S ribosomal protein L17 [Algoriphagus sp.]MDP4839710.1 50S ribosomal protein L17 [Algoriphagus sp.]MDP4904592.1 50S ribosomal protein L17 [Algoriphagus sp.]MDP4957721.1 50S ribosomal protein L17 [Algoriphagus sp.]
MRHGKKINHLGRTASHRKAMLSNMGTSLILHKRISTTLAKAKELKKFVEPLVTRAKEDTTHNRRIAFSYLKSKEAIKALFGEVIEKVGTRPGGYTRIIKTGFRLGDNAEMCIIELVDFNELMLKDAAPAKKTTRRSRRSTGTAESTPASAAPKAAAVVEETPAVEAEIIEETPVAEAEVVEETTAPVAEAATEETPTAETSEEETEEK